MSSTRVLPDVRHHGVHHSSMATVGSDPIEGETLFLRGRRQLISLFRACGLEAKIEEGVNLFRLLTLPWGERLITQGAAFPSDVGGDHSPFEFSVAFGDASPEVRFLVEAHGDRTDLVSRQQAGLTLNQLLHDRFGVDLRRFDAVADLFLPKQPQGLFAVWHAVGFFPDRPPQFKVYLNPRAKGPAHMAEIVEEALHRLGLPHAFSLLGKMAARGPLLDTPLFFSLDLDNTIGTRVKVYFRHHKITAEELEECSRVIGVAPPGTVKEFCRLILGHKGPYLEKAPATCVSFRAEAGAAPNLTVHLPIERYRTNPQNARASTAAYLAQHDLPVLAYFQAMSALADEKLSSTAVRQSYASYRLESGRPRVTIYIASTVYPEHEKSLSTEQPCPDLEEMVQTYKQYDIARHPLFCRMDRESVDLTKIWLILANTQIAIADTFAHRLANLIARVDDGYIRSIFVKQLNDELGNGDFDKAHSLLFAKLLSGLSPWRPRNMNDALLEPGRRLRKALDDIYFDPDPYIGIGASVVMEVVGQLVDTRINGFLKRKKGLEPESLAWLTLHEELEVDHVDEVGALSRRLPRGGPSTPAVWKGADATFAALWRFADENYALVYEELGRSVAARGPGHD